MASSITVEVHGKRMSVHPKPMQPVGAIISTALDGCHVTGVDPSKCQLLHNGKHLDLNTPFRFANIPTGAKLVLQTGHEPTLGLQSRGHEGVTVEQGNNTSTAAVHKPATIPAQAAIPVSNPAPAPTPTPAPTPAPAPTPEATQQATNTAKPRPIYIFHRQDLVSYEHTPPRRHANTTTPCRSSTAADEPDDFFNFTEADYHVVAAGYAARVKQQAEPLKTKAMREAEAAARASAFASVRVRVQLPDGHVVQVEELTGSDPLATVRACLEPLLTSRSAPWYLYTAPPKTRLRDESLSLYALQLVPAALLYVGCDGETGGAWVRDCALQAHGRVPEAAVPQRPAVVEEAGESSLRSGAAPQRVDGDKTNATASGGGRKVPKWMKL